MSAETEREEHQLKKRFQELAEKSYHQNRYTFTGFLSLAEQDVLQRAVGSESPAPVTLFGGNGQAERQMARFGSPETLGYEMEFPIVCVEICPLSEKFAEPLSHRDYLGALMNLGIERSTLGDIVQKEKRAYLFCTEAMAPFICENLTRVRHTSVRCGIAGEAADAGVKEPTPVNIIVSSERLDGVIAKIYHLSRGQSLELFSAKRIYVNGRQMENNSYQLRENDSVTVRGMGKFRYEGAKHTTRKGKLSVSAAVFQ